MRTIGTAIILAIAFGKVGLSTGCSGTRSGPYQPASERSRDTEQAQKLTQQAAKVMREEDGAEALDRAEKLLLDALTADLYHGPAHNNLGVVYLQKGMLYEAANEFEWARKLMPGHPDPRMNLALTLEQAGQIEQAIETYMTALETYPGHMPTIQALTRLELYEQRQIPETIDRLNLIALRGDSDVWQAWAQQQLARLSAR